MHSVCGFQKAMRNVDIPENLLFACRRNDVDFVRTFAAAHRSHEGFSVVDENGMGPLHHAVIRKSYECIEILLSTKLVDIRSKSVIGTCLDLAISCNASNDIIQLLLENDPDFRLTRKSFGAPRSDDQGVPARILKTIIDKLHYMNYPFSKSYDFLGRITHQLRFFDDRQTTKSIRIFQKVVGLVVDETESDFMQSLLEALLKFKRPIHVINPLFRWCIEKWHLNESNKHYRLVQKLLENPAFGFDDFLIFCLHSDVRSIRTKRPKRLLNLFQTIFDSFLNVDIADREVVGEVANVLWSKVNTDTFSYAFCKMLFENQSTTTIFDKMLSAQWLDATKIGEKLNVAAMQISHFAHVKIIFKAMLPFTVDVTADEMLLRNFNNVSIVVNDSNRWRIVGLLDGYENDADLSEFCVDGMFRAKCSLKGLCRTEIRKTLLQSMGSKKSHSRLVKNIQSLELPKSIQRFLFFNCSNYDF